MRDVPLAALRSAVVVVVSQPGERRRLTTLERAQFVQCGQQVMFITVGGFKEISAADFEKRRSRSRSVVLDVRSPEEFAKGHIPGAVNTEIHSPGFATKVAQFDKKQAILVNCHAGSRGAIASAELAKLGFKTVCNLDGGPEAWTKGGHLPETSSKP